MTPATPPSTRALVFAAAALLAPAAPAHSADLVPQWLRTIPTGPSWYSGLSGIAVAPSGVAYVAGNTGSSNDTDILVAAFATDGTPLWSRTWNGPGNWHDTARGIFLGPGNVVYVTGTTPGPGSYANVIVLGYDGATGALLRTIHYSSGPGISEHGSSVAVDEAGRVFVAGGTVGDGSDGLVLAFDAENNLLWSRTWDGPPEAPYSGDDAFQVQFDPAGNPVVLIYGVMPSLHPDYVVVKYDAASGATLWEATYGTSPADSPRDMAIDAAGDVYVTGQTFSFVTRFTTIKLSGADGTLLWEAHDAPAARNIPSAIVVDNAGGVYVTGNVDPDGNQSNHNEDVYTVKRAAADGALAWTRRYGASCVGCYDVAGDLAVDASGHVFVAGQTSSAPYSSDAILFVLSAATGAETDRGVVASDPGWSAGWQAVRLDAAGNAYPAGRITNPSTGQIDIALAKYGALGGGAPPPNDCRFGSRSCRPATGARAR
jgi:hypothetical protein